MHGTEMPRTTRVVIRLNNIPDTDIPNVRPTKSYLFYLSQRFVLTKLAAIKRMN